jgi:hypothetical protein
MYIYLLAINSNIIIIRLDHQYKQLLIVNHILLFLDYSDMILTHQTTSSSLDCLSMIVESIDPTKLVHSSNSQCY